MIEETRKSPSPKDSEAATDRAGQDPDSASANLRKTGSEGQPGAAVSEAIDRATAAVGHDDGKR